MAISKMKVALTGTPGTGKTSVSEHIDGFDTVHLSEFVKDRGLGDGGEPYEVDVEAMKETLSSMEGDKLIEGHLSHRVDVDYCVVLRCDPEELRDRLERRGYRDEKIKENLESECIDILLQEAVKENEKVFELDTTDRDPEESAEIIREAIREMKEKTGVVDWTDSL